MGKKKTWLRNVSDNWLRENFQNFRWCDICEYKPMNESMLRELSDMIDWHAICEEQSFGKEFVREFQDHIGVNLMFSQKNYDEKFLDEVMMELEGYDRNWTMSTICRTQKVSEQFLEKWLEEVDWNEVSKNQDFSEDFMRKHKKDLNWVFIKARNIPIPKDLETYAKVVILFDKIQK